MREGQRSVGKMCESDRKERRTLTAGGDVGPTYVGSKTDIQMGDGGWAKNRWDMGDGLKTGGIWDMG